MIRAFVKFYSTGNAGKRHGCRLLDYVKPETHFNVPRPSYLLGSRTGNRYNNLTPQYNDELELLTILKLQTIRDNSKTLQSWPRLAQKLHLDPHLRLGDVDFQQLTSPDTISDINRFIKCIEATKLAEALTYASKIERIPHFLVLFTLSRHPESPLDVYNATRLFELWLPQMPEHVRPEITILMIKMAQKYLVEVVPVVTQLFVDNIKDSFPENSTQIVNEMLWQLSRFTKFWHKVDVPLIIRAQEILLTKFGVNIVDTKGLMAMAYVKHFDSPETARKVIDNLLPITLSRDLPQVRQGFAYNCAPVLIKMFTSPSVEEALVIADRATVNKTAIWTNFAVFLARKKLLNNDTALKLWNTVRNQNPVVRISALLTELIIGAISRYEDKHRILQSALSDGLKLSPTLVAKMLKTSSKHDLEISMSRYPQFAQHSLVLEQLLQTQSNIAPDNVWSTYCLFKKSRKSPSRNALQALCRAAWNPKLLWDNMYASQRALREFKLFVRGAADGPADDIFRLYPTDSLLYAYVVMVGRSGYHTELMTFLQWMDQLRYDVPKRVLCALIHYSPQGPALLRMAPGFSNQWPTAEDLELYQNEIISS